MNGRIVLREDLSKKMIDQLFNLIDTHFDGVTIKQFQADLDEKKYVIIIENENKTICGFSTIDYYAVQFETKTINVIYSGDTIIAREAWGSSALFRSWINSVWDLHQREGEGDLYWFLVTSGFRTYRLLPLFWKCFWTRCDQKTPPRIQSLMQQLASEKFGDQYDPSTNIIRFKHPQKLKGDLVTVPETRRKNPHVDYFLIANPNHHQGDELVNLALLTPENLTAAGQRMVQSKHLVTPQIILN